MIDIIEQLHKGLTTHSPEETKHVAIELAKVIPVDTVLALHGDLGAGKTTFVKGLAEGWGITQPVTSPTFNIFSIYKGTRTLLHLDAYRLRSEDEVDDLLLEDFLISPYCLVVEWPENIKKFIPDNTLYLYLSVLENETHFIKMVHPEGVEPPTF